MMIQADLKVQLQQVRRAVRQDTSRVSSLEREVARVKRDLADRRRELEEYDRRAGENVGSARADVQAAQDEVVRLRQRLQWAGDAEREALTEQLGRAIDRMQASQDELQRAEAAVADAASRKAALRAAIDEDEARLAAGRYELPASASRLAQNRASLEAVRRQLVAHELGTSRPGPFKRLVWLIRFGYDPRTRSGSLT